jgi:hypothetical protein
VPSAYAPSCLDTSPLTVELAVQFVRRESAALAAALRASGEPERVDDALQWHEEAHRPWLALLAGAHRAGWCCGAALDRLYSFHGRLAELLDRGCRPSGGLGELLADHLDRLTADAVAALRADAGARRPPATSRDTHSLDGATRC